MQSKAGPLVGYERVLIIVGHGINRRVSLSQGTETAEKCQVVFRKGWAKRNVNEGEEKWAGGERSKRKECPWKKQLKEAIKSQGT